MSEVDALVEELLGTLGRACDAFYQPMVRDSEGGQEVFLKVRGSLAPPVQACVRVFVRRFLRSKDYKLKALSFKRGYVTLSITHEPREPRPEHQRTSG